MVLYVALDNLTADVLFINSESVVLHGLFLTIVF